MKLIARLTDVNLKRALSLPFRSPKQSLTGILLWSVPLIVGLIAGVLIGAITALPILLLQAGYCMRVMRAEADGVPREELPPWDGLVALVAEGVLAMATIALYLGAFALLFWGARYLAGAPLYSLPFQGKPSDLPGCLQATDIIALCAASLLLAGYLPLLLVQIACTGKVSSAVRPLPVLKKMLDTTRGRIEVPLFTWLLFNPLLLVSALTVVGLPVCVFYLFVLMANLFAQNYRLAGTKKKR